MTAGKKITGIPGMDSMLGGGFPPNSVILLEAPPGSGKSTFCHQFAKEGLGHGEPCVYISTGEPVSHLRTTLEHMGADLGKNIQFIDCYSWRIGGGRHACPPNTTCLPSLTELNELDRMVKESMKRAGMDRTGGRVILDSVSDLLLYAEPASVFKFLQLFVGIVKGYPNVAVVTLESGLHEDRHISTVNYICDGTIQLKMEGNERNIRVSRMLDTVHPLQWIPFTIGKRGVEIKVEDFFR